MFASLWFSNRAITAMTALDSLAGIFNRDYGRRTGIRRKKVTDSKLIRKLQLEAPLSRVVRIKKFSNPIYTSLSKCLTQS